MLGPVNVTVPSPSNAADRPERVNPMALAAVVSVVAAVVAVVGNLVMGIGEAPLVIGTLVVASVAGWANVPTER